MYAVFQLHSIRFCKLYLSFNCQKCSYDTSFTTHDTKIIKTKLQLKTHKCNVFINAGYCNMSISLLTISKHTHILEWPRWYQLMTLILIVASKTVTRLISVRVCINRYLIYKIMLQNISKTLHGIYQTFPSIYYETWRLIWVTSVN